jgi:hypothetical protein
VDELRALIDRGADGLRVVRERVVHARESGWLAQSLAELQPLETRPRAGSKRDSASMRAKTSRQTRTFSR